MDYNLLAKIFDQGPSYEWYEVSDRIIIRLFYNNNMWPLMKACFGVNVGREESTWLEWEYQYRFVSNSEDKEELLQWLLKNVKD